MAKLKQAQRIEYLRTAAAMMAGESIDYRTPAYKEKLQALHAMLCELHEAIPEDSGGDWKSGHY